MKRIVNKKRFYLGIGMMLLFSVLLALMFIPMFDGQSMMAKSDNLYNNISKSSAYYIDDVLKESDDFDGTVITAVIEMDNEIEAGQTAVLYELSNAQVSVLENTLEISGVLSDIINNATRDAEAMYENDIDSLDQKYKYDGRRVIYNWSESLEKMEGYLTDENLTDESEIIAKLNEKAIQPAYNYFGIEPEKIFDKTLIVIGSLSFYVFYTMLYGFALMFILEGLGLKIGSHRMK